VTRRIFTERSAAEFLVGAYGQNLRFVDGSRAGRWIYWTGSHWANDSAGFVFRAAKATTRAILLLAARMIQDDELRSRVIRFALSLESKKGIDAIVALARTEPGVAVPAQDLDSDPWLLNVANGTIDLRTGELLNHRREDLISKLAPVAFDPAARDPIFERFLDDALGSNPELRTFLQRAAGYTLTGLTDEEIVLILLGPEASGKTTLLEALRATLGSYAIATPFGTFLKKRRTDGPSEELARLSGARLVIASEAPRGQAFDEALLKLVTGGDTISARRLYGHLADYRPQFTIWLAANDPPRVNAADGGVWRRLQSVPFEHSVPRERRDPAIKAHLCDPERGGPAILAWAVQGCLEWQAHGLQVPEIVRQRTQEYRDDMDHIGAFFDETFEVGPGYWTAFATIMQHYRAWSDEHHDRYPLGPKRMAEELRGRGFEPSKRHGVRGWQGLRPRPWRAEIVSDDRGGQVGHFGRQGGEVS
jgi:putative DNA primase/helicase